MPQIYYRVEAPGVNILNTVTEQVVTGLLDELDLVRYFKDAVYILSSFTAKSQYGDGAGMASLVKNRCDVDVNYIMDKSQVPWPVDTPYTTSAMGMRSSYKGNHTVILSDEKANILIEHMTVACAIEMNFVLSFQTFDDATKAFDTIQSKYKGSLIKTPFDLSFSYPVSMGMLEFLISAFKAKTDYIGKTLEQYLADMQKTEISWDVRKTQLTNTKPQRELMVRCLELRNVAQLTMDQKEPDVRRTESLPDGYTLSFQFVIQFGRPALVIVNTPVSVDNTVLPYGLFENTMINFHYNPWVGGVYQDGLISDFISRKYGNYNYNADIIRIPAYDDWTFNNELYNRYKYRPFLIAHFTLDGATSTINLKQLDDVVLHPVVQEIMKETGSALFDYGALFHVSVWAGNLQLSDSLLAIDDDLNLTVTSSRPDKVYHLVLSETTNLQKTEAVWNSQLIRYRYFFPMTIERNIQELVRKKIFLVEFDSQFLALIDRILTKGQLRVVLLAMTVSGEWTNDIFGYTQNPSQLADFLALNQSQRAGYTIPTGTDPVSVLIQSYYATLVSTEGRSLLVAFIEQCMISGYITNLSQVPGQYLDPNSTIWPYAVPDGGYYGFNTPVRVFNYNYRPKQR